ncbi:MAG TPA: hypothetical protein DEV98_00495 [Clostridiales bacterium]|nr:hypothetical protein [Clostridiales bacterium]
MLSYYSTAFRKRKEFFCNLSKSGLCEQTEPGSPESRRSHSTDSSGAFLRLRLSETSVFLFLQ